MQRILVTCAVLAGCASSTGIVAIGGDAYMVTREDNSPATSLGALKVATFKEAGAFCSNQGKQMRVIKNSDTPQSFGQFPQPTLQFSCG